MDFIGAVKGDKHRKFRLIVSPRETVDRFLKMQTFNAVVEAGSFVKAADALAMFKAAVSRYVVDMEPASECACCTARHGDCR